jgi:hypothetical protein
MKFIHFVMMIIICFSYSQDCDGDSGWCYESTINQAFYIIEGVFINGTELIKGNLEPDGSVACPNENCDIVGAFNGDICVGWSFYYINEMDNKFTLNVNGYDGFEYSEGYLLNGQVPTFKVFNMSTQNIIDVIWTECYDIMSGETSECQYSNFGGFILGELNGEDSSESISEMDIPNSFSISNIYPNPFNPITQVDFILNQYDQISISIFDIKGNSIETHFLGFNNPGRYSWEWMAKGYAAGPYFIHLKTSSQSIHQKVILLK